MFCDVVDLIGMYLVVGFEERFLFGDWVGVDNRVIY